MPMAKPMSRPPRRAPGRRPRRGVEAWLRRSRRGDGRDAHGILSAAAGPARGRSGPADRVGPRSLRRGGAGHGPRRARRKPSRASGVAQAHRGAKLEPSPPVPVVRAHGSPREDHPAVAPPAARKEAVSARPGPAGALKPRASSGPVARPRCLSLARPARLRRDRRPRRARRRRPTRGDHPWAFSIRSSAASSAAGTTSRPAAARRSAASSPACSAAARRQGGQYGARRPAAGWVGRRARGRARRRRHRRAAVAVPAGGPRPHRGILDRQRRQPVRLARPAPERLRPGPDPGHGRPGRHGPRRLPPAAQPAAAPGGRRHDAGRPGSDDGSVNV